MGQEIVTLQKQIDTFARNQKVMEDRQKKYKEHHKIIKSRDLIPRPKGRPGRSHGRGYRVTEAMGLSKKKEYFNYLKRTIRKLAKRRLDTSRTLTQQKNGLMVEEVVFQAQVECKIFRKYENAWPVRDLLAQYLRNRSRKEKIDAKKFELFETQHRGGKRKVEDTSVSDEESSNSDSSENVNGHVSDIDSSWSEMGDANEECDASLGGCSEGMHADSDGGSDEDPRLTKSKTTKTLARSSGNNNSLPRKRRKDESEDRRVDSDGGSAEDSEPLKIKPKKILARSSDKHNTLSRKQQPRREESVGSDSESDEDHHRVSKSTSMKTLAVDNDKLIDEEGDPSPGGIIPKICPGMDCQDAIPDRPSEQLKTALSTYVDLVKPNIWLATEICILIKREQRRLEAIKVANDMNWPAMRINFEEIPNRVLKLYNELQRIVFDKAARNGLFLWNSFKADLEFEGYTIAQFSRLHSVPMTSPIWRNSRIGYYGPKGTAIIMHTLIQLFPFTTLTDAFQPLSLRQYFTYFVIPHIACRLIAEDLSISATMNAYKVMVESSNVGELINSERDDDNELDLIKHRTMLVLRQRALGGRTIHDAAKALVSLQVKTPDVPDASVDQSNPRPRAKPHVILYPPKRVAACGASDHEEASENQVMGRASVVTSTCQALPKKPRGRFHKKAPVEAEADEHDPGLAPTTQGRLTRRNVQPKCRRG